MTLLKFIEKEPKFIYMEEMLERLEKEPEKQYKWIRENHARKRSRSK
ncbi:hypothetical protein SRSM4_082 [Synechococcus phage S-RSM4]|uniref:Uncharacterized protein n=1 Tax=Synechococcus phage S-RSM4 TaxID=555387 RepID=C7BV50_9CAUD|nr:hypothetical protein SRSM4_082 [Synechococcus phage S-RSM4]CAR63279.1 hypothetical protein SRSM4_082 [Synechococcus phage S-RSM4]